MVKKKLASYLISGAAAAAVVCFVFEVCSRSFFFFFQFCSVLRMTYLHSEIEVADSAAGLFLI